MASWRRPSRWPAHALLVTPLKSAASTSRIVFHETSRESSVAPERAAKSGNSVSKTSSSVGNGVRLARAGSLRDAAYDEIKNRIISCAFRPGEYINELQLSSIL